MNTSDKIINDQPIHIVCERKEKQIEENTLGVIVGKDSLTQLLNEIGTKGYTYIGLGTYKKKGAGYFTIKEIQTLEPKSILGPSA